MSAPSAPLATLLDAQPPESKITLRTLYTVPLRHLSPFSHPNFSIFHPFFKNFFAQTARQRPPCAESPRRTLIQTENPGIPRQNRPFAPRRRPDFPRKTLPQNPKKPAPHAPPHKKVE